MDIKLYFQTTMRLKILILLLSVCLVNANVYSQKGSFTLQIDFIPELKDFFKGKEINISIWDTSSAAIQKVYDGKPVYFESLYNDSVYINISLLGNQSIRMSDVLKVQNDSLTHVVFPGSCKYNLHIADKICPKCKKANHVIPIWFGLEMPLFDKKGNEIKTEKHYSRGCIVSNCDPHWYCEKDKFEF